MRALRTLSLVGLVSGCAAPSTTVETTVAPAAAEATLHALEDQWADAYVHHDAAKLAPLLDDDYIMTMNLGGIRTKEQYVNMVRTDTLQHQSIVREQERIRVYGNAAVVTYRPIRTTQGVGRVFRSTDVWIFREGRWQLVARQITDVPPP